MTRDRPPTKRLFFALWPREVERQELESAARRHAGSCGGAVTRSANLHVTLAFLGSVAIDRVNELIEAAADVRGEPFRLHLNVLEYWRRPRIVALCAERAPPELLALERVLWQRLGKLGFEREVRPFRAHATLARRVYGRPSLEDPPSVVWQVDEFALVESVTDPAGARYAALKRWPLRPTLGS